MLTVWCQLWQKLLHLLFFSLGLIENKGKKGRRWKSWYKRGKWEGWKRERTLSLGTVGHRHNSDLKSCLWLGTYQEVLNTLVQALITCALVTTAFFLWPWQLELCQMLTGFFPIPLVAASPNGSSLSENWQIIPWFLYGFVSFTNIVSSPRLPSMSKAHLGNGFAAVPHIAP